jgi:glutamine synthetase
MYVGIPVKHVTTSNKSIWICTYFEETNLAVDHNCLLMDVMEKVAERHDLKVLFHEKPFKE